MIYVALLNAAVPSIVASESFADGDYSAARVRYEMFDCEALARGRNASTICRAYWGSTAPSVPAKETFAAQPEWRRVTYYGPGDAVVVSETFGTLGATLDRYEMLRQEAYTKGAGYRVALALS